MFAFGQNVRRLPKDLAGDKARIRKGKVFGRTRSLDLQTTDDFVLPNITTTQLTLTGDAVSESSRETSEAGTSDKDRTTVHQIIKRGRLRDSTSMLQDNEANRLEELEGLLVSKLSVQCESPEESQNVSPFRCFNKERKQRSQTSQGDSGFFEDSGDDAAVVQIVPLCSPTKSDKVLSGTGTAAASQKTPRIGLEFKMILNQDKTVIRNTERLKAPAKMCLQSPQSLYSDLVAYKNTSIHHKGSISENALPTHEQCVKMREVVLKNKANSNDSGATQSDTSLAVLKTRRRLLRQLNSCPPFPLKQCRNKERALDLSRATCNCKHRVESVDAEQEDTNERKCESCPVDLRTYEMRVKSAIDFSNENLDCAVSTTGLTEQALKHTSQSQEIMAVNVKCQEWLNRWIAF